ncbi:MAG: PilZ domain-containing protein [Myxococcota bacterium]
MSPSRHLHPNADAERRTHPRIAVFWPARIQGATGEQEAVCFNVSHGGLGLYLWSVPSADEALDITLVLPAGVQARAFAHVSAGGRVGSHSVGMQLVEHPQQTVEALHAYIDRRY